MMVQWLIAILVLPAVLGVGVALGEPWFRSRAVPTRFLWMGAMTVSLAWAPLAVLLPRATDGLIGTIALLPPVVVEATVAYIRIAAPAHESVNGLMPLVVATLIVSAMFGVCRLGIGWLDLIAEGETWRGGRIDGCDVLVSRDRGPAVVGMVRPKIVLPEWIESLDCDTRRIVLQHEREHTLARDVATLFAASVIRALVPWNPGIRWIGARLALAIEHDCDLRVLRSGVAQREYEQALLVVADRIAAPRLVPSLSESPSHLERRITAMRTLNRRRSIIRPVAACGFALAGLYGAFALLGARAADAQSLGSSVMTVARDTIYLENQVEHQAAVVTMAPPIYPTTQRAAGVSGELIVQVVVDTLGRVEPGSLKVIKSDHENFTAAVRLALDTATFKPATKGGQRVRQLVQMPFVFKVSPAAG